jgi:Tol biopolymer transport system component
MRLLGVLLLALTVAVAAPAAERQTASIMFVNAGGLFSVTPGDSNLSLVRGNVCPGTSSLPCPVVKAMSWSPDGTRLAFTFGTELHLFDSRDGTHRALPTGVDVAGESPPAWSPDSRHVAFATVLIEEGAAEARPAGSYSSGTTSSASDLYMVDVDGGTVRRLTNGRQTSDPAWAPGQQIVYSSLVQSRWELFVVEPGGGHRQLTEGLATVNRRPSWSPDGTEIAFLRDAGGLQPRLNAIRPDGSGLRQLSNLPLDPVHGDQPAWSPDGSTIAVSTSVNGRRDVVTGNKPGRDLYLVSADGSGERRLTQSAERGVADRGPTWSPDGSQLAFESFDRDRESESALYTANADGRCERRVAAVGGWRPVWQPLPGSAIAPRECSDLGVVTIGPTAQGKAARLRVRLLNDGTTPLSTVRLRSSSTAATVLSARAPAGSCSLRRGGLACRISRLAPGASADVELLLEARVLRKAAGFVFGPKIGFVASTATVETSLSNNRQLNEVSTRSCTAETAGGGSVRGTTSDDTVCGRRGNDRIAGLAGDDHISAGAGNDVVKGGPGNDVIVAGPGTDVVSCGAGLDRVTADAADRVAGDCERVGL